MFNLSIVEHILPVLPHLLCLPLPDAIKQELEKLFLDKVIPKLGLCVSVYDVRSIKGGQVVPGEGHPVYKMDVVSFGKLEKSTLEGLCISLGFFNDIYVPVDLLQEPSTFREDGIWTWKAENGSLTLDLNEKIRFVVKNVKYPPVPIEQEDSAKPFAPMEITGSICQCGLGLVSWWDG